MNMNIDINLNIRLSPAIEALALKLLGDGSHYEPTPDATDGDEPSQEVEHPQEEAPKRRGRKPKNEAMEPPSSGALAQTDAGDQSESLASTPEPNLLDDMMSETAQAEEAVSLDDLKASIRAAMANHPSDKLQTLIAQHGAGAKSAAQVPENLRGAVKAALDALD